MEQTKQQQQIEHIEPEYLDVYLSVQEVEEIEKDFDDIVDEIGCDDIVEIKVDCPYCEGEGKIYDPCPGCEGSGIGSIWGGRCTRCGGSGSNVYDCEECDGEGKYCLEVTTWQRENLKGRE